MHAPSTATSELGALSLHAAMADDEVPKKKTRWEARSLYTSSQIADIALRFSVGEVVVCSVDGGTGKEEAAPNMWLLAFWMGRFVASQAGAAPGTVARPLQPMQAT